MAKSKAAEVAAKAKALAEDVNTTLQTERSVPATPTAISDAPTVRYEERLVQSTQPSKYPQVYDPKGNWCGFFLTDAAARAWVRLRPKKGAGYVVNNVSPPRKERVVVSDG